MNAHPPPDKQDLLQITDQLDEGIVLTDEAGRIRLWNHSQEQITGLKREEVLNLSLWQVYLQHFADKLASDRSLEHYRSLIQEILKTGHSSLTEKPFLTDIQLPNGEKSLLQIVFLPLPTVKGFQVGMITHDLTTSRELLRQAHLSDTALVAAANGIVIADPQGYILWVNPAYSQITGYSQAEAVGETLSLLKSGKQEPAFYTRLWEVISSGKVWHGELLNRHKDGSLYYEEQTITPVLDEQGNISHYVIIMQDITERKQVEESTSELAAIVDSSNDAIIVVSLDHLIKHWNPAAERIYGYTAADVEGRPVTQLAPAGHQDEVPWALEKIAHGEMVEPFETERIRKDGRHIYASLTISPILGSAGKILGASIISRDITERKQRDLELEGMVAVANALRAAKNRAEMLPAVLGEATKLLNARGAAMALPNRSSGDIVFELAIGNMANWTGVTIPKSEGISGLVIRTGKPYLNEDVLSDPRLAMADLLQDPRAVACVPLIAYGEPIAALWASRDTPFSDPELRLLNAIADMSANAIQRAILHEQTEQRLQRLAALHAIDNAISSSLDLSVTLGVLLDQVIWQLGVDAADVLLYNPHSETLEYAARRGFSSYLISHTRLNLDEGCAGQSIQSRQIVRIPNLPESKDRFARAGLLAGEGFVSYFAVPLIAKDQVKGVLDIFHRSELNPDREWMDFLEALAKQAAIAIDNALLFRDLQRTTDEIAQAYDTTLEGWVRTLGLRDGETEDHTQRVTEMTLRLASAMDIDPVELDYIRRGALLHDIGKMGIPDSILLKPGPLTPEEREIIRRHPVYAYELLQPIAYLRPALDIPYCHHEKWDGTGYPRHLKKEEIPLAARLFAIADVWDALTSNRPYRTAWSTEKARRYVRDQAGKHFDPQVVEVFFKAGIAE
jgi:PAS domain S-box-containing protein/putative nucleotidyltransferase with HDIG domain